jgi:hypothetical protein
LIVEEKPNFFGTGNWVGLLGITASACKQTQKKKKKVKENCINIETFLCVGKGEGVPEGEF